MRRSAAGGRRSASLELNPGWLRSYEPRETKFPPKPVSPDRYARRMGSSGPPGWDDWIERLQKSLPPIPQIPTFKIPQETLDALNGFARVAQEQLERFERQFANVVLPSLEAWQLRIPDLSHWAEIADTIAKAARVWREEFIAAQPPNWRDLDDEDIAFSIVERIQDAKVCLVWLPRADVLRLIMDAPSEDTPAILLVHRDDVLEDATRLLDEATSSEFTLERDAARDAIAAFHDGHFRAAQTLAAATFTSACHVWFEQGGTGRIAETMRTLPDRAAISQLRIVSIFEAGEPALRAFNPLHAKPRFKSFNRHNTAHRITSEQFTEANTLAAIMLVTALLREVEEWPSSQNGDAPPASV